MTKTPSLAASPPSCLFSNRAQRPLARPTFQPPLSVELPVAADGLPRKLTGEHAALAGNGRFQRAEKTMWNDEDLDIPTYLRRSLSLDR